jgi:hypothetical protein
MGQQMFHVANGIRSAKTVDGAMLLDIRGNRILAVNHVGAAIFELISLGKDEGEIVEVVSAEYEVPVQAVSVDFRDFRQSLQNLGILVETSCGEIS